MFAKQQIHLHSIVTTIAFFFFLLASFGGIYFRLYYFYL